MTNIVETTVINNSVNILSIDLSEFEVVDIREMHEQPRLPQAVCSYECWPLSEFDVHFKKIEVGKKYLFFCQAGVRSVNLIEQLHQYNCKDTYSLDQGVFAFQHIMESEDAR